MDSTCRECFCSSYAESRVRVRVRVRVAAVVDYVETTQTRGVTAIVEQG